MKGITVSVEKKGGYKAEFGITKFPYRKRPCLFIVEGTVLEVLAYFQTEEKAEKFKNILEELSIWKNPG